MKIYTYAIIGHSGKHIANLRSDKQLPKNNNYRVGFASCNNGQTLVNSRPCKLSTNKKYLNSKCDAVNYTIASIIDNGFNNDIFVQSL